MEFQLDHLRNAGAKLRRQLIQTAVGRGLDRKSGGFVEELPGGMMHPGRRPGIVSSNPDRIPTNFMIEHNVIKVEDGVICVLTWTLLDDSGDFPVIPDEFNNRKDKRIGPNDRPWVFADHEEAQNVGQAAHAILRARFVQWANNL